MISLLLTFIAEKAYAGSVELIGGGGAGIADMWNMIAGSESHRTMGVQAPWMLGMIFINFVLWTIGGAAIVIIIYASIQIMSSGISEENLAKGKKTILYAALGLIFATISSAIILFVQYVVTTHLV